MVARNDKASIRYRQFVGGYAQALDSQLKAVLAGYQRGLLRRNEVRVFAARLEQTALHQSSNVSLSRIINCQSQRKGNRRLSSGEIQTAIETLDRALPPLQQECEEERGHSFWRLLAYRSKSFLRFSLQSAIRSDIVYRRTYCFAGCLATYADKADPFGRCSWCGPGRWPYGYGIMSTAGQKSRT